MHKEADIRLPLILGDKSCKDIAKIQLAMRVAQRLGVAFMFLL